MAPTFLKQLRRRSKASFKTENSTDTSSEGAASHGTGQSTGSVTPPSLAQHSDPALNMQIKEQQATSQIRYSRPPIPPLALSASGSSRNSVANLSAMGSPSMNGRTSPPLSQYAPRIHNISENSWVYQKVILLHGTIGDSLPRPIDGTITVGRFDDSFPAISWPVCDSHFKILVYLQPGPNKIRLDFSSPKLANSASSNPVHASYITLHMLPPLNTPPLQLAIIMGSDSEGFYDTPPAKAEREGNGLETAIKKFRMAAYLWQAFTAEQMSRNRLGRRTFRFEEEWMRSTTNIPDREAGAMRSDARVHVIRCDKTVAELRDLNRAQQYKPATDKNALFNIAAEAIKANIEIQPGQQLYVSALLIDAHWDTNSKTITGHAALGGNAGDLHLAVFGSHCLHSYPTSFEEVVPAFSDCTPTDTRYVANDCNEAGSSWEAANIGIGAHLHETGHLFGCPHQEEGVMLRDYVVLNRSFSPREPYSTRTKSKGGLALQDDECGWHRLDCLRFRAHPAFRLPCESPMHADGTVQAFSVEAGNVVVTASSGVSFVEIYGEGDDVCRAWIEYPPEGRDARKQITLTDQEIRSRLANNKSKGQVKISIKSHGNGSLDIQNLAEFSGKNTSVKLDNGRLAFKGGLVGSSQMDGTQPQQLVFSSASKQGRVMSRAIVYHGSAIDGIEFVYDDNSTQLFGKRGGKVGGDSVDFDIRRGEYLSGFAVRAGFFIDGIQIITSLGRRSAMFGNPNGGSLHTLIPPRGYTICGVAGSCGAWLDGFSVLIKR